MKRKIAVILVLLLILPVASFGQPGKSAAPKVSFDFIDADIRNVIRILADVSGKNVVMSDAVKGKVTMKLENVYWDEALDIVGLSNGLKRIESDGIIRIVTQKEFEDERKNKDADRDLFRKERLERQRLGEEFITETAYLSYTSPADMDRMLRSGDVGGAGGPQRKGFLSEFGSITQVSWNNALIIRDTKENVASILSIIKTHDIKPKQIQIDCKIVQATSTFSKELGIQWGANYTGRIGGKEIELGGGKNWTSATVGGSGERTSPTGATGFRPGGSLVPYAVNLPATIGAGSGGVLGMFLGGLNDSFLLDIQLSALEAEGKGRILSNPKVITSDNKKAIIQQGKSIPYKTVSQTGTQTQFAEAVLGLEVTPSVTMDGYIKLDILAKKDQADFINQADGVPTIDKKQASTVLYIRDGETAVIGGIYESQENNSENGLPGLRRIPLLGWLFKKQTKGDNKTELLIFITPRIVRDLYKNEG